jgi:hypothetical protein
VNLVNSGVIETEESLQVRECLKFWLIELLVSQAIEKIPPEELFELRGERTAEIDPVTKLDVADIAFGDVVYSGGEEVGDFYEGVLAGSTAKDALKKRGAPQFKRFKRGIRQERAPFAKTGYQRSEGDQELELREGRRTGQDPASASFLRVAWPVLHELPSRWGGGAR